MNAFEVILGGILISIPVLAYLDYQSRQQVVNKYQNERKQETLNLNHNCRLLAQAVDEAFKVNAYGRTAQNPLFKVLSYEVRDDCFITIQSINARAKVSQLLGYAKAKNMKDISQSFGFYRDGVLDFQEKGELKVDDFHLERDRFKEIKIYPDKLNTTFVGFHYSGYVTPEYAD